LLLCCRVGVEFVTVQEDCYSSYRVLSIFVFFFFFQAEDGIRDKLVTGVQTCALPILRTAMSPSSRYTTERVCSSTAEASDATNSSSSPIPSRTGDPRRATTIFPGSSVLMTARP